MENWQVDSRINMEMQRSELAKVIVKKNKVGRLTLRHAKRYYDSAVFKKWDVGTAILSSPVGQIQAQKQTREYVTAKATAVWKGNAGIFHRRVSLIGMWGKKLSTSMCNKLEITD